MRIVFMGTPEFAVPVLDAIVKAGHEVVSVISQPDREKDKKGNTLYTPVKQYALQHSLPCFQFEKVSLHTEELKNMRPDVIITAAFGQLLSADVLEIAEYGVLNVHASLLPKYRGSSPIQSAILAGESVTGVTVMKTELSMDTGDMLLKTEVAIEDTDTAETLSYKLSFAGADLIVKVLDKLGTNNIKSEKQIESQATYCKKIAKANGLIDWNKPATEIACMVRAYNPWPVAFTYLEGVPLKIYSVKVNMKDNGVAGTVKAGISNIKVFCGEGSVLPEKVQLPGKKVLSIADFLRGRRIPDGCVLKNE